MGKTVRVYKDGYYYDTDRPEMSSIKNEESLTDFTGFLIFFSFVLAILAWMNYDESIDKANNQAMVESLVGEHLIGWDFKGYHGYVSTSVGMYEIDVDNPPFKCFGIQTFMGGDEKKRWRDTITDQSWADGDEIKLHTESGCVIHIYGEVLR